MHVAGILAFVAGGVRIRHYFLFELLLKMKQFRLQKHPEPSEVRAAGRNRSSLHKLAIKSGAVSAPDAPRATGGPASWPESMIS